MTKTSPLPTVDLLQTRGLSYNGPLTSNVFAMGADGSLTTVPHPARFITAESMTAESMTAESEQTHFLPKRTPIRQQAPHNEKGQTQLLFPGLTPSHAELLVYTSNYNRKGKLPARYHHYTTTAKQASGKNKKCIHISISLYLYPSPSPFTGCETYETDHSRIFLLCFPFPAPWSPFFCFLSFSVSLSLSLSTSYGYRLYYSSLFRAPSPSPSPPSSPPSDRPLVISIR